MKLVEKDKLKLEELLEKYHFKKGLASTFKIQPKAESYCVFDDMYETRYSYVYSLNKLDIHWENEHLSSMDVVFRLLESYLEDIQYNAKYDDSREAKYKITKVEDVLRKLTKTEKKLLKAYFRK